MTLVDMVKGDQRLQVHPNCVAAHARLGWMPAPSDRPADLSTAQTVRTTRIEASRRRRAQSKE